MKIKFEGNKVNMTSWLEDVDDRFSGRKKKASNTGVIKVPKSELKRGFRKVASNLLVRKSKRDFWEISGNEDSGNVLVLRKISEEVEKEDDIQD